MVKLITADECENLPIEEVWRLYSAYVNPSQVEILSKFSWGRDLFHHAEGMYLYTTDGRRIMDFTGGIGVLDHGHNHPRILSARKAYQEKKRMEIHKVIFSPYLVALCHNIAQLLPGDLNKSFFPNSGAESVEGAIKMAYKASYKSAADHRDYILFSDIAFHGKLIGTGTISGMPQKHFDFPKMQNTASFEYGNLDSVKQRIAELRRTDGKSNVYAIIIEPFHASTATHCSAEFLYALRELCDAEGIALIFDEVYTGWGKTGSLFYFMRHEGLVPDIVTMSKSFGGGKSSISAYTARDSMFERAYGDTDSALIHTSTYNGFGEECATALESIQIIVDDDHPAKARALGDIIVPKLEELIAKHPKQIKEQRGVGAFNAIILNSPFKAAEGLLKSIPIGMIRDKTSFLNKLTTAAVVEEMYREHNILAHILDNRDTVMLGVCPSLIAEKEHVDYFIESLDNVLSKGLATVTSGFAARTFKNMVF